MTQEEMLELLDIGDLVEYLHKGRDHKTWVLSYHTLDTIVAMVEAGYYTILRIAKYADIDFLESEEFIKIKEASEEVDDGNKNVKS